MKSTAAIAITTTLAISAFSFLSTFGLGQTAFAAPCARFYKERDNHGASFSVCNTNSNTVPRSFNDKISSINIPRGRKCILYTDAKFKGRSIEFKGTTGLANLQPEFDNQVSSIQCTTE
ncbi:hypothetical protein [Allocoleopsis sp.]|uniref:hypothetical protein n=1 Tax=Allocoleopsis sp. TaxID=3088169 RepID=UPI002FD5578D